MSDGIAACAAGLTPGEWVWVSPIVDAPWPEWMILDEDPVPLEEVTARTYPWAVQLVSGEWCRLSFWVSADSVGVGEHAYNCTRPPEAYIAFPDHRRFYSERRHLQVTTEEDEDRADSFRHFSGLPSWAEQHVRRLPSSLQLPWLRPA